MNVLHVTSGNLYGGIETMLVAVARHSDATPGMTSQFGVCFDGRFRDELVVSGAKVHNLGSVRARNPIGVRRARRALVDIVASSGVDVVVCHSAWPLAIFGPAARTSGKPLVLWQHSPLDGVFWLERWSRRTRPDLIICNSSFTAASVRGGYPNPAVAVLHCPVTMHSDADRLSDAEREAVRSEFSTLRDDVVIVQVSRMEEWKGHRLHLEALARLRDMDGWVCWMVGGAQRPTEARLFDRLRDYAEQQGIGTRVRFLGQRSDVMRILAAADIHCQPNTKPEAFGITFIEAMTAGLPVVATEMGGAVEIVDASCGILTPKADAAEVERALRGLIGDRERRRQLGAGGPARAHALCDPIQQLARLQSLLEPLGRQTSMSA
jgi:glycosyltransferase involved in cell wall biosynthesis